MAARRLLALGIATALLILGVSPPALLAADKTLTLTYVCSGGPFDDATLTVPISVPDTASGSLTVTWSIPQLTLAEAPTAATQVKVYGKLNVTGGTHADLDKPGASVTAGSTTVQAAKVTSTVTVTATSGQVTIAPPDDSTGLQLSLASAPDDATTCLTTTTDSVTVTVGQADTGGGDVISYTCGGAVQQDIKVRVTLTMPTDAQVGRQFAIGWTGAYVTGSELKAPATGTLKPTLFAYAALTGVGSVHSGTGEGPLGTITPGQVIPLPTGKIDIKTTVHQSGTAAIKPASLNFGARTATGNTPIITCRIPDGTTIKSYPLTVGGTSPSTTPSATPSSSPSPSSSSKKTPTHATSRTPREGPDTGAGGESGPDGRVFILVGALLLVGAGIGGLILRRRVKN